jgi:hypothetical protein
MKYIIAMLLSVTTANAELIDINVVKNWNNNGVSVGHEATVDNKTLHLVGSGTAVQKVGNQRIPLFVVQIYAEIPMFFVRNEQMAIESASDVGLIGIRITSLRWYQPTILWDAINKSSRNPNAVVYQAAHASVSGAYIAPGETVNIVGSGGLTLVENAAGIVTSIREPNAIQHILSLFIGDVKGFTSLDLKEQLLQHPAFTYGDKQ